VLGTLGAPKLDKHLLHADHFLLWQDPEKMLPTIAAFLDAPMPEAR
jgi:hypothetical protein